MSRWPSRLLKNCYEGGFSVRPFVLGEHIAFIEGVFAGFDGLFPVAGVIYADFGHGHGQAPSSLGKRMRL